MAELFTEEVVTIIFGPIILDLQIDIMPQGIYMSTKLHFSDTSPINISQILKKQGDLLFLVSQNFLSSLQDEKNSFRQVSVDSTKHSKDRRLIKLQECQNQEIKAKVRSFEESKIKMVMYCSEHVKHMLEKPYAR
ncbi:UNKNOWN [Stylonychia lemnae]|uniref:Uncharacterized protein n=1 Tax=Stylonychia lemnae TaxID=5949 RepID=A0A078AYH7_STYLE|nr:UNKNOWN [Stylonychia lemnae]|eukprot:CDW87219.1 UNKNOWN [Stylonychia lemnae]